VTLVIHVLTSPDCVHGRKALDLVREVVDRLSPDARVETVEVSSVEDAARLSFRGSPTVLVEGVDIEPGAPGGIGLG
jgi:hypothetical protein